LPGQGSRAALARIIQDQNIMHGCFPWEMALSCGRCCVGATNYLQRLPDCPAPLV
jgi:hypothetical protein